MMYVLMRSDATASQVDAAQTALEALVEDVTRSKYHGLVLFTLGDDADVPTDPVIEGAQGVTRSSPRFWVMPSSYNGL
jgi:hypothetical protein